MYLGHHYAYKREAGEPQVVLNYYRAFVDYVNHFTFGRGVHFRTPKATEAIVPDRLERVWEQDNDKLSVLLEMGQQGGVSGDCFVKVAYEEPYEDSIGRVHPGRVRILPLNAAFCFPEFHPHDRSRLLRFKLKYRFWGCVDTQTEALTKDGWKSYDQLVVGDEVLALDPDTDEIRWEPVSAVNVYDYSGDMVHWSGKIDAVSTPNHRWLAEVQRGRGKTTRYEREIVRTRIPLEGDKAVPALRNGSRIVVGGGTPMAFSEVPKFSDEAVETVAWYVTEGWDHVNQNGTRSVYLAQKRPAELSRVRRLANWWKAQGATFSEYAPKSDGVVSFYLGKGVKEFLWDAAPNKQITPEFLTNLTHTQAELFYNSLIDGDGHRRASRGAGQPSIRWTQVDDGRKDGFEMLCAMLGMRTSRATDGEKVQVYQDRYINAQTLKSENNAQRVYLEDGKIWCPTLPSGIWFARRGGSTYWTGNTSLEGTRQVFTYTEILTDDTIEEYINDELIDQRPNPIGTIPVVHIPNLPVSGSPWGLSDAHDIIAVNRQYNEISTDIADIINYHAAPVTVIVGAKASQLEKGPKKVWGGLPKDSQVFNLEGGNSGVDGALRYLEMLKRSMHEIMGVPETALGQMQPISNTSGVALSIQYQPLMNKHMRKVAQYSRGIARINELIMLTLAVKEPDTFLYNPATDGVIKPDQYSQLDPQDPLTYVSYPAFPPPLPLDKLVVLNEVQAMMGLGLESKEGALRTLGEEFPDQKLAEIRDELVDDAKADGALNLVRTQINKQIMDMTGMMPGPDGTAMPTQPMMLGDGDVLGDGIQGPPGSPVDEAAINSLEAEANIRQELIVDAYGTKIPQRRSDNPET